MKKFIRRHRAEIRFAIHIAIWAVTVVYVLKAGGII